MCAVVLSLVNLLFFIAHTFGYTQQNGAINHIRILQKNMILPFFWIFPIT